MKFLPWPRSEYDLLSMRKRVDVSSKTMFFVPGLHVAEVKCRPVKACRIT